MGTRLRVVVRLGSDVRAGVKAKRLLESYYAKYVGPAPKKGRTPEVERLRGMIDALPMDRDNKQIWIYREPRDVRYGRSRFKQLCGYWGLKKMVRGEEPPTRMAGRLFATPPSYRTVRAQQPAATVPWADMPAQSPTLTLTREQAEARGFTVPPGADGVTLSDSMTDRARLESFQAPTFRAWSNAATTITGLADANDYFSQAAMRAVEAQLRASQARQQAMRDTTEAILNERTARPLNPDDIEEDWA